MHTKILFNVIFIFLTRIKKKLNKISNLNASNCIKISENCKKK